MIHPPLGARDMPILPGQWDVKLGAIRAYNVYSMEIRQTLTYSRALQTEVISVNIQMCSLMIILSCNDRRLGSS